MVSKEQMWNRRGSGRRTLALFAAFLALGAVGCDEPRPQSSGATLVPGRVIAPHVPLPVAPTLTEPSQPTPSAPGADAEAIRAAWLAGPLTGRDNRMARHREARISQRADGTYEVYVKNQFAFRCAMTFGPDGRPALFARCRSGEAGWRASPASLPVTCTRNPSAGEESCEAPFSLLYPSGGGSPAALRIVRVL